MYDWSFAENSLHTENSYQNHHSIHIHEFKLSVCHPVLNLVGRHLSFVVFPWFVCLFAILADLAGQDQSSGAPDSAEGHSHPGLADTAVAERHETSTRVRSASQDTAGKKIIPINHRLQSLPHCSEFCFI